jgi:hypothetical protein
MFLRKIRVSTNSAFANICDRSPEGVYEGLKLPKTKRKKEMKKNLVENPRTEHFRGKKSAIAVIRAAPSPSWPIVVPLP